MDMTPQFIVFIAMIMSMLVEIPVLFVLLQLLGVRKYGDVSLTQVALWAAVLTVSEYYIGWRMAGRMENEHALWLATLPTALISMGVFGWIFSLPVSRSIAGGFAFFALHFWIIPLLPQPQIVELFPQLIVARSEATATRPLYQYDSSLSEHAQWYSQLKAWEETRPRLGPLLDQLAVPLTDDSAPVRINQLSWELMDSGDGHRVKVFMDCGTMAKRKSTEVNAFMTMLPTLKLGDALFEEVALDYYGPDLREGYAVGAQRFKVTGFFYLPRPGDHSAMKGLSQNALQLAVRGFDDWMRVENPAELPGNEWSKLRAARVIESGNLGISKIQIMKAGAVSEQSGGHFLKSFAVRLETGRSWGELVRAVKHFEADKRICWITRLDLRREAGDYICTVDVSWPVWATYEIDCKVASFLGKKVPEPVIEKRSYEDGYPMEDDEYYMLRMQNREGYTPAPYR